MPQRDDGVELNDVEDLDLPAGQEALPFEFDVIAKRAKGRALEGPFGGRGAPTTALVSWAAFLVAAVVVAGFLFALSHRHVVQEQQGSAARSAAATTAIAAFTRLTSADYRKESDYVSGLSQLTTGSLHDQLQKGADQLFSGVLAPSRAVLSSVVTTAAVSQVAASSTSARAMVLGTVTTKTSKQPSGQQNQSGYDFRLGKIDGRWLVTSATAVSDSPEIGTDTTGASTPTPQVSSGATSPSTAKP